MPRNSSGTYTLPLPPVVSGEVIEADWANESLADIAQALSDSLDRLGRGGMLAPFFIADGLPTAPGLAFSNEPTTGLYRTGMGAVGIATQGVSRATFDPNGISTSQVLLSGAITTATQAATKKYVDDAVAGGGGGGTGFLPLSGGVMTGNIRFSEVADPFRFFIGATDVGNVGVTATKITFTMGTQNFNFTAGGVLTAGNFIATQDITANNDVYAKRWVGVGPRGALLYDGNDATYGPYLGFRSSSAGSALTLFDDGYCASSGYRALNELASFGIVTAYNAGVKYRSGSTQGAGRFMDCRIDAANGSLVWYNESGTPVMWITQTGDFGRSGAGPV